jgi:hypothetical protein
LTSAIVYSGESEDAGEVTRGKGSEVVSSRKIVKLGVFELSQRVERRKRVSMESIYLASELTRLSNLVHYESSDGERSCENWESETSSSRTKYGNHRTWTDSAQAYRCETVVSTVDVVLRKEEI